MRPRQPNAWAVILAGGVGSRFWPASTPARPKQLLPLADGRPLIVGAWERAEAVASPGRVRILAPPGLVEPIVSAAPEARGAIWVEPEAKGTAPALARAAWEIESRDPGAVMVALHADHVVAPAHEFSRSLHAALRLAHRDRALVCVAIGPDRPETGYGYIEPGPELAAPGDGLRAFRVKTFREKPDRESAVSLVNSGWLWNSGIFAWLASVFLEEVRLQAPEVGSKLGVLAEGEHGVSRFFSEVPSCVVDRAVLERSPSVAALEATFEWDDIGTWEALARLGPLDECGNALRGRAKVVEGSNNIVFAEGAEGAEGAGRGRVVLYGVDDTIVVRTAEETLVISRDAAADLKHVLEKLGERT